MKFAALIPALQAGKIDLAISITPTGERKKWNRALLLVEELLAVFCAGRGDQAVDIDLTLSYSEKQDSLDLMVESAGDYLNPFEENTLSDQLGITIVKNLSENMEYRRVNNRNRVCFTVKK
ncbi:hypothetical protein PTH_2324 [Pelotomaculum thermopropionicum SI]|uniref:Histidine kinase/HSP90-like ATPase domain-containing protein n=1 Tax=Pelotomaculum thermopropionicum (strain DSM 13744 / JCM 10971 / SI) TaxID=370438 RepID=A5CZT5_PELTS|nr:hypothetical protein PTH_2324 [Pelotomaculum thermopropionicum SI]